MKGSLVILAAFDPYSVDSDRESIEFCSDVTKKIEVRLLRSQGLGPRSGVDGRLSIKANGN